ncbi:hypothetical protein MJO29_014689 [Puccinia striiformis f. sp. tritici]|nr:hypothetical protein MJO29_014689 [Puccinia striiformis f. sp. tritici]
MKIHSLFSSLPVVILILGESLYVHSFNCQHPKTDGYTQALCATEPKQLARRDTGSSSSGGSSGTHLDDVKGKSYPGLFPGGAWKRAVTRFWVPSFDSCKAKEGQRRQQMYCPRTKLVLQTRAFSNFKLAFAHR